MTGVKFDKLVRDRVPAIADADGWRVLSRLVTGSELTEALRAKLVEEVEEYLRTRDFTELADVYEVLSALARHEHKLSIHSVVDTAEAKAEKRGRFVCGDIGRTKGVVLENIEPPPWPPAGARDAVANIYRDVCELPGDAEPGADDTITLTTRELMSVLERNLLET